MNFQHVRSLIARIVGLVVCLFILLYGVFKPSNISISIGAIGVILTGIPFCEPLFSGLSIVVRKRRRLRGRGIIYRKNIELIQSAKQAIRFLSPTCSWGSYSAGLRIFEELCQAIRTITGQGKEVRIICDVWDWERTRFALALQVVGAQVKYLQTTKFRYFLVKDSDELLIMNTDPDRIYTIPELKRPIRQLQDTATFSRDENEIKQHINEFDDLWASIPDDSVEEVVAKFRTLKCPCCDKDTRIEFQDFTLRLMREGSIE